MNFVIITMIMIVIVLFIIEIAFIIYGVLDKKYQQEKEPKIYKIQTSSSSFPSYQEEKTQKKEKTEKILVLYATHQFNASTKYFLEKGIFEDNDIHFYVIFNNSYQDLELPSYVHYMKRNNFGYDFGGWSDALLTNDFYKNYDKFVFLNSSVMGPFLPSYCKKSFKWPLAFTDPLSETLRLQGISINVIHDPLNPHVQSFVFSMNKETLEYLIKKNLFTQKEYPLTYSDAIQREIKMSKLILEHPSGTWNIASILKDQENHDWHKPLLKGTYQEDPTWKNSYHDQNLHPYQSIFVKVTHGRVTDSYLDLIQKIF